MAFYLAGEITQVIDSVPWVRCASGNVFLMFYCLKAYLNANEHLNQKFLSYPNLHADNRRGLTGGIVMADLFISD